MKIKTLSIIAAAALLLCSCGNTIEDMDIRIEDITTQTTVTTTAPERTVTSSVTSVTTSVTTTETEESTSVTTESTAEETSQTEEETKPAVTTAAPRKAAAPVAATTKPVHKHSYKATVYSPNCISQGYTEYICSCGDLYQANFVKALGHSYSDWTVTEKNSVKTLYSRKCVRCGVTETKTETSYPAGNYEAGIIYGCELSPQQLEQCAIKVLELKAGIDPGEDSLAAAVNILAALKETITVDEDSGKSSLYNALAEGRSNSLGFAAAFKYLCDACGVSCELSAPASEVEVSNIGALVTAGESRYFFTAYTEEPEASEESFTSDIKSVYSSHYLVSPVEFIAKACTALGTKYASGGKGAGGLYDDNNSFISIYDGAVPEFFTAAELSTRGAKGIDCSGLVYWALGSLGVTSEGFNQSPMTLAAETWHYYNDNSTAVRRAKYIRNGETAEAIVVRDKLNSKSTHYWAADNGGTIPSGSVVIVKNPAEPRYDHTWIYIGEASSRKEIIDILVSDYGVNRALLEKEGNVVDKGNGSTHWRIESAGGSVQQVQINNGEDGLTQEYSGTMAISIGVVNVKI